MRNAKWSYPICRVKRVDESLDAIGIASLQAVRMLWEHAPSERAPFVKLTSSQRKAMKRKREQQCLALRGA